MTNDDRQPLFDRQLRERFYSQRVLVLDGGTATACGIGSSSKRAF